MNLKEIEKIPHNGIKDGVVDFDIESVVTKEKYFDAFKDYLSEAYSYCFKTNRFSGFSFKGINNASDRTQFQEFMGAIESGAHQKILFEAVQKECKTFLRVDLDKYKEIETKLNNGAEFVDTVDGGEIKFGFSTDKKKMLNMAGLVVTSKRDELRKKLSQEFGNENDGPSVPRPGTGS